MIRLFSGFVGLCCVTLVMADSRAMTLRNNPFSQPEKQAVAAKQEGNVNKQENTTPTKKLRAVIVSDIMPMANLDGQIIKIGEEVDGYKLLAVKEAEAVFEWQGEKHTLTLRNNDLEKTDEARSGKK